MKGFIFLTKEGHTFQPGSTAIEPDIDNLQVLGFGNGVDLEQAFKNFLIENKWLSRTTFQEVICIELRKANCDKYVSYKEIPRHEVSI